MIPLYEKFRPKILSEIAGQEHLIENLSHIIRSKKPVSLLFYGPPGSGKTTCAKIYANAFNIPFLSMTGVLQSTADLKKILKEQEDHPLLRRQTILFFDEIHRLNRAQQDIFLPFLENGSLILIGATTENPSFSLNSALLSRLRVFTLQTLSDSALLSIIQRCESLLSTHPLTENAKQFLVQLSQGDARYLLNLMETISQLPAKQYDTKELVAVLHRRAPNYDKDREGHYNLISALHKSVRGSDPDAALYWFCRMLDAGEDPLFIGRRLIRMATEDIGLTDPAALGLAMSAYQSYQLLGSPEGDLSLANAVIYLALCPKSNAVYTAYKSAKEKAKQTGHLLPPKTILNAPTPFMKEMGYGDGYIYDHDTEMGFSGQSYFPPEMERQIFYNPVERGFEREMDKRLKFFKHLREKLEK